MRPAHPAVAVLSRRHCPRRRRRGPSPSTTSSPIRGTPSAAVRRSISPDGAAVLFTVRALARRGPSARRPQGRRARTSGECRPTAAPRRARSPSASTATASRSGRPTAGTSASSRRAAPQGDEDAKAQIYVMRTDGGEAWKLTDATEERPAVRLVARQPTIAFTMTDPRSRGGARGGREARRRARSTNDGASGAPVGRRRGNQSGHARDRAATTFTVAGRAVVVAGRHARRVHGGRDAAAARRPARRVHRRQRRPRRSRRSAPTSAPTRVAALVAGRPRDRLVSEPVTAPAIADGTPRGTVGQQRLMLYDVATKRQTRDITGSSDRRSRHAATGRADGTRLMFTAGKRAYNEAFALDLASGTRHAAHEAARSAGLASARTARAWRSRWTRRRPRRRSTSPIRRFAAPQADRHQPAGARVRARRDRSRHLEEHATASRSKACC